jgi:RNA-binding protein YlmH
MRLDTLIGEGFGMSRSASAELIRAGMASVNHVACDKPDHKAEAGDLLSVRGKGRIKIMSAGDAVSRKGRLFVELGIYG